MSNIVNEQIKEQLYDQVCDMSVNELYNWLNKYDKDKLNSLEGQLLHAQTLEFNHPTKNERVSYKSNLPKDFKNVLDFLEKLSA